MIPVQEASKKVLSIDIVVHNLVYFKHLRCGLCPHPSNTTESKPVLALMNLELYEGDIDVQLNRCKILSAMRRTFGDDFE